MLASARPRALPQPTGTYSSDGQVTPEHWTMEKALSTFTQPQKSLHYAAEHNHATVKVSRWADVTVVPIHLIYNVRIQYFQPNCKCTRCSYLFCFKWRLPAEKDTTAWTWRAQKLIIFLCDCMKSFRYKFSLQSQLGFFIKKKKFKPKFYWEHTVPTLLWL